MAVQPHFGRIGEVGGDFDETRPELGIEQVEVVDPDPALLADEVEALELPARVVFARRRPTGTLGPGRWPRPRSGPRLGLVEEGPDVIELAVVPTGAVRLLQLQDRDVVLLGEGLDLAPEAVPDLLEECRRRDRVARDAQ